MGKYNIVDIDGDIIESLNIKSNALKLEYAINNDDQSITHHYQVSVEKNDNEINNCDIINTIEELLTVPDHSKHYKDIVIKAKNVLELLKHG